MKIKYWLIGYTAIMLIIFFYIYTSFANQPSSKRDMVYYNEQHILVSEEMKQGKAIDEIEKKYDCDIILMSDKNYEINLQEALKNEALLMDYFENDVLKGKLIWNVEEQHYQMMEESIYKRTMLILGLVLLGGYLLLGYIYIRLISPFHKLQRFSRQVAKGNLDFPLPVDKHDYFGAFTVRKQAYDRDEHLRTIMDVEKLYDVSAVDIPAYNTTELSARSFFDAEREKELKEIEERETALELAKAKYFYL